YIREDDADSVTLLQTKTLVPTVGQLHSITSLRPFYMSIPFGARASQVSHGGSGLLHQMDRSGTSSLNLDREDEVFLLEKYYMIIWITERYSD
ncbi:hypothetical protein CR513_34339, partial [Mucuna pruriens]